MVSVAESLTIGVNDMVNVEVVSLVNYPDSANTSFFVPLVKDRRATRSVG